jgi:catechol 2,3-dioxygenase-like lactoylglutathione lyase family enzyme
MTRADDVGDLHLGTVVVNTQDLPRAADFWCAALGYRRRDEGDGEFLMLLDPGGRGLPLLLQRTENGSAEPVRLHLDLYTGEQQRHVERLVALGATRVEEWSYPPDADFVVLRDPDGNEFCVIDRPAVQAAEGEAGFSQ